MYYGILFSQLAGAAYQRGKARFFFGHTSSVRNSRREHVISMLARRVAETSLTLINITICFPPDEAYTRNN